MKAKNNAAYIIAILAVLLLVFPLLISCAETPAPTPTPTPTPTPPPAPTPEPKPEPITLRCATGANPGQSHYEATVQWAKMVEERTDGAVTIEMFPSGQLYGYAELKDVLVPGDLDLGLATPGSFGPIAPAHSLDWLDFAGPDLERGWSLLEKLVEHPDFIATIDSGFKELGVKLLFYTPLAVMKGPMMVNKPVRSMEDIKGSLIYAPSPNVAKLMETLGAKTTYIATGEVYTALQRKTFDGVMSTSATYWDRQWYEECKYMTDYPYNVALMMVFVSRKTWDKLPEDVQQVMLDAAQEVQASEIAQAPARDKKTLENLAGAIEIVNLTPQEMARWDAALLAAHEADSKKNERTQKVWELWTEIKKTG